jgi:MoxR-like ATPase
VGKSFAAKAIAKELDIPFIDVRGSTMDESDMGIPDLEASKDAGAYTKMLPSWYVRACREPVVLMLDELNRSLPQVMQGFFQVVLDRELGNGPDGQAFRLHPETRVIAAVNVGNEYDVNEMDPALLRRFWVTEIEPTVTNWVEWAKEANLDSVLVEFVQQNPEHWRVDPANAEPGAARLLVRTLSSSTLSPGVSLAPKLPSRLLSSSSVTKRTSLLRMSSVARSRQKRLMASKPRQSSPSWTSSLITLVRTSCRPRKPRHSLPSSRVSVVSSSSTPGPS